VSALLAGITVAGVIAWRAWAGRRASGLTSVVATFALAEGLASWRLAPTPPDEHTPNAWRVHDFGFEPSSSFPLPSSLFAVEGRTPLRGARPRAVVLGDSFAAGEGVQPGEDIGSQLALAWPGVEVFNHGQSGLGFHEELALYNDHSRRYAPDVLVWVYVLNDLPSAGPSGHVSRAGFSGPIDDRIVDRSGALEGPTGSALIDASLRAWRGQRVGSLVEQAYKEGHDPRHAGEALDRLSAELRALVASRAGAPTLFVIWPLLHRLEDYPFEAAHGELVRRAAEAGAVPVDLLPHFAGTSASRWWASPTDHHPNAEAQRRAAEVVAAAWQPAQRAAGVPPPSRGVAAFDEAWASGTAEPSASASALRVARARLAVGAADAPSPFDARRVAVVSLLEAVALARSEGERAEVEAEVAPLLRSLQRSGREGP
jgi:hypothetical protein